MARLAAGLLAVGAIETASPAGADATCDLTQGGRARVVAALDGDTLALEDGTLIRLINTLAPQSPPAGTGKAAEPAQHAHHWLEATVVGRSIRYAFGGRREDRHGRLLAQVFLEGGDGRWVQGALAEEGLARVYSFEDNRACVSDLLAREEAARQSRRGLWAGSAGAILPAEPPDRALAEVGRFVIVEGQVLSVGERRLRTYLNFGTYWNVDFTVMVAGRDRDRISEAGMILGTLAGKTVRVRGWILDERGPAIAVTHPEQIEIVEDR